MIIQCNNNIPFSVLVSELTSLMKTFMFCVSCLQSGILTELCPRGHRTTLNEGRKNNDNVYVEPVLVCSGYTKN